MRPVLVVTYGSDKPNTAFDDSIAGHMIWLGHKVHRIDNQADSPRCIEFESTRILSKEERIGLI